MSDFKLLLQRRKLLNKNEKEVSEEGHATLLENNLTVDEDPRNSSHCDYKDSIIMLENTDGQEYDVSEEDGTSNIEFLETEYCQKDKKDDALQPILSEETTKTEPPEKVLIYSAGTIRNRYRNVRKEEEMRLQKKHERTIQKHSMALIRESLGVSDDNVTQSQVCKQPSNSVRKKKTTHAAINKNSSVKKKNKGKCNSINEHSCFEHECVVDKVDTVSNDECRDVQNSCTVRDGAVSTLSNVIASKEAANESVEVLMLKYYEEKSKRTSEEQIYPSEDQVGKDSANKSMNDDDNDEETVTLTESVPLVNYPVDTCIIDGLVYSKFCTDPVYKGDIIMIAKKYLQQRRHVLLRSPLHYFTADKTPVSDDPLIAFYVSNRDILSDADRFRDCKQVLKSVFMACAGFSSDFLPPDTIQRTTIKKEVVRKNNGKSFISKEDEFLLGKSISQFVEVEMLIPPKSL